MPRAVFSCAQAAKAEPPKPASAPEPPAPAPTAAAAPKEPAPRQEAATERVDEENHNEKVTASAPKEEEIHVTLTEDSPMEDKIIFKFQVRRPASSPPCAQFASR